MRRFGKRLGLRTSVAGTAVMAAVILIGALVWFVPYLRQPRAPVAGVPAPPPLFAVSAFTLAPHQMACMNEVTVEPNARLAEFDLRPASPGPAGGPPVRLVLQAPHYRGMVSVPGGYPGGAATLPIMPGPPSRSVLATACFTNLGNRGVELSGSTEPRTIARSPTTVDGRPVVGDISLAFFDTPPQSLLRQLGDVFAHASNLTEGLIPVWLIWAIAVLALLGLPVGMAMAFYFALRDDEARSVC